MAKKTDDKVTDAGAVELEENELDQVTGGVGFLKIDTISGESIDKTISANSLKLADGKRIDSTVGNKQEPYLK